MDLVVAPEPSAAGSIETAIAALESGGDQSSLPSVTTAALISLLRHALHGARDLDDGCSPDEPAATGIAVEAARLINGGGRI